MNLITSPLPSHLPPTEYLDFVLTSHSHPLPLPLGRMPRPRIPPPLRQNASTSYYPPHRSPGECLDLVLTPPPPQSARTRSTVRAAYPLTTPGTPTWRWLGSGRTSSSRRRRPTLCWATTITSRPPPPPPCRRTYTGTCSSSDSR